MEPQSATFKLSTYEYPPFGELRCDWFLEEDVTKVIFNYLSLKEKMQMLFVSVHWCFLVNAKESGETLLKNAQLNASGEKWMQVYKLFQKKILCLIFVDFSNSMNDLVLEKKNQVPVLMHPKKDQEKQRTRLEIAKAKALEIAEPVIPLMAKKMVYCGQFGADCSYTLVKSIDEVKDYFDICQVNRTGTFFEQVYPKINEIHKAAIADLKIEDCKLEITILSDFDCQPNDLKIFKNLNTDIRFVRIDNTAKSLIFQRESIKLNNELAIQEPDESTEDTVDIEIDLGNLDNIVIDVIKHKPEIKALKRVIEIPTAIVFTDVDDEVPLRPLKRTKTNETSNFGTKWG